MGRAVDARRKSDFYETNYLVEDQQRMARAKNYFAWQKRLVMRDVGRRVVEVGCGIGNFTGNLLDREAVLAIDAVPECVERVRLGYPNRANLHTMVGDAARLGELELGAFRPDSCVCLNVLEHIENDSAAVRGMASLVGPGGVVVLLVPAFPALYGPIDRMLEHRRRYTRRGIAALAGAAGLRVQKLHYVNGVGFFGWWLNARVFRRREQSAMQIEVFDRFVVPWLSRVEEMAAPPFGQSLFAVLRKP